MIMIIKVLGTGCKKCKMVEENVRKALEDLGIEAEVVKVTNLSQISEYVMLTPGLVIDERVVAEGKVSTVEEIKKLLS